MPKRTDIKKVMVIGSGSGRRVRLCGDAGLPRAERGGVRGDPGEFQSGDDHDRHAYRRQGLYGAADARIRGQDHPLRASRCHRAGAGRPDGPESGRAAGQEGRARASSRPKTASCSRSCASGWANRCCRRISPTTWRRASPPPSGSAIRWCCVRPSRWAVRAAASPTTARSWRS